MNSTLALTTRDSEGNGPLRRILGASSIRNPLSMEVDAYQFREDWLNVLMVP